MMKKNLNVDAMILDLRNVQEDFLDRYEQIKLDCMIALTSPPGADAPEPAQHFSGFDALQKMSRRRSRWVWSMARSR